MGIRMLLLSFFLTCISLLGWGQHTNVSDVIQWAHHIQKTGDSTYTVTISAKIKENWHIFTDNPGGDGSQIPTTVKFNKNRDIQLLGKIKDEGKVYTEEIKELEYSINYYKNAVKYEQKLIAKKDTKLDYEIEFQICDDERCLPPSVHEGSIAVNGVTYRADATIDTTTVAEEDTENSTGAVLPAGDDSINPNADNSIAETQTITGGVGGTLEKSSLLELFIAGLVAGFIAFIMPCIYAMLPITVSFFTKRSKTRSQGIKNAVWYSLSIIGIFTILGALISLLFSEKTMYELSTSMGFNLFVFLIFVVFGVSLLGAFEINLPSSWSSKLDSKANTNSFMGIFFMALVLVVVSFSCTSAFISSLIVYIVKSGNSLGGVVGFAGFGLAIALPFALGALFPGLINNLAKSGGWLNSVKVVMGFLELAMAMKFLSNVDLANHWGILDFEVYLAIWIVIFLLMGLYLLGIIRFSHDDDLPKNMFGQRYLSVTRLFFAIAALSFTAYMIPGMFGAPLTGISGFLPERKTLNFNLHDNLIRIESKLATNDDGQVMPKKYTHLKSELPGVISFFDYQEALAAAKEMNKPVLLDFTGHSCVNCRKMERAVLSKPEVLRELNQHFVVASLYCDDKSPLLPEDQYISSHDGSKITNIGQKNLDIELSLFGEVAQPLYVFVTPDGKVIQHAGGYEPDVPRFLKIIEEVKAAFQQSQAK